VLALSSPEAVCLFSDSFTLNHVESKRLQALDGVSTI